MPPTKGKGGKGEDADEDAKDAAVIANVSEAVTTIAELTAAMRTEQKEDRTVLVKATAALQNVQDFFQSSPNASMIKYDEILGEILREPKIPPLIFFVIFLCIAALAEVA